MPRRKRTRRHKKHNQRNHFGSTNEFETFEDDPMRTYTALEVPSIITAKFSEELGLKINERTPSPNLEIIEPTSRSPFEISRKRRSISQESHMGCYSGLPCMFNLSENAESFITDLRTCQSSTILESPQLRTKFRSSSSMAKLHSPGIEKVPLKTETGTQTCNNEILTETPRINHDDKLFEIDYENLIAKTPSLSGYKTPLKRIRLNDLNNVTTPIFDLKDTAMRIQDLNNFQTEETENRKVLNCSRVLSGDSLKRLQNFNELILNTSQSIDYDNCEENEKNPQEEEEEQAPITINYDLSGEISFFTPQLYNGKSASTPIIEKKTTPPKKILENKIEIIQELKNCKNVGVQTSNNNEIKFTPALKIRSSKEKFFSVTKRRSYKSLSPPVMYYKASPKKDLRLSPIKRISLERTESDDTIAAIETCARIIGKIKKYHGKYSSKLPAKIIEICTWLGLTIKKGVTSLYKLYSRQKALNESANELNCNMCNLYRTQITTLKTTMEELSLEMNQMKQEYKEKCEKLDTICTEVDQLRRELIQFKDLPMEIKEIKERLIAKSFAVAVPPPPPPPPPPPLLVPSNPLICNRSTKIATRKKDNNNARPIISLDDILKVKLKKIGDRPSPLQRRATEPLVSGSVLKQIKLRPTSSRAQTPSSYGSLSGTSSLSNSPCSSLTRILTNVDTNVRQIKRLKRTNGHSFNDFSRKNRRERENNCDYYYD